MLPITTHIQRVARFGNGAETARTDAEALLVETRNYLRSKGCTGL